jgi:hypothetical protein
LFNKPEHPDLLIPTNINRSKSHFPKDGAQANLSKVHVALDDYLPTAAMEVMNRIGWLYFPLQAS